MDGKNMNVNIAYLAGNKLVVQNAGETARQIESKFGIEIRTRMVEVHKRDSWKTRGRGARFMSGAMLWGQDDVDLTTVRINITGLGRGRQRGEVLYALNTDDVSGVFLVDIATREEKRLFHTDHLFIQDLCAHPEQNLVACSVAHENCTSHIATMQADGSHLSNVTEGDSVDQSPHWIPGAPGQLIFQSADIGRDQAGYFVTLGPFSLQRLNLGDRALTTVLEDARYDFLSPQMTSEGGLFYIRRPYRKPAETSLLSVAGDILLSPLRLLYAIFQWLNFFTARYTGRPLTTAGGPKRHGADIKQMMIWGNLIDAEKALQSAHKKGEEAPSLVPKSWELMYQTAEGKSGTLARNVLCYDLCSDGSVVYSNGSAIYHIPVDGKTTRIAKGEQIIQMAVLE
jgi:hypothetical protein